MNTNVALPKLLVVDDDQQITRQILWALSDAYTVITAGDRATAIQIFEREEIAVALLDLGLPPSPRDAVEGLRALDEMISKNPMVKVIIVSGNSDRQNALLALERGAFDIFAKPINLDELTVVVQRAFRRVALEKERIEDQGFADRVPFENIVGSGEAMKAVFCTMRKVSQADVPVLICGESGTGKELIASAIHNISACKEGPFIAINCGAIPETLLESELFGNEKGAFTGATSHRRGKLEYADGGTLFLDEIGDLAPPLQVKLLRFLQEKVIERVGGREPIPVSCRVIAATHRDLDAFVKDKHFREDLYFRLAVVKIVLPPLRLRGDDVVELANNLVELFSRELKRPTKRFTAAAVEAMRKHPWPGNVRELQNRIKRALVLAEGSFIAPSDLELGMTAGPELGGATLRQVRQEVEKEFILNKLKDTKGNISKAARALGISRPTLYELMERYGLE